MVEITIPEPTKGKCPGKCPFYSTDEISSSCALKLSVRAGKNWFERQFEINPGPDCPGPGKYHLVKEA